MQSLIKGSGEAAEQYTRLDEKYTQLILEIVDTKKDLGVARRELAQTKLTLVNKQNKNLGTSINSIATNLTPPPATPPLTGTNEIV